eukprot:NODE_2058_length_515_cov_2.523605_g1680_i0.p3 GENE.NODE_2058_length_515_cov_2.523605_g1680_i0~~NODE_2058_length_515_cov_2.523605_g1680_i0.p3  ORF type:complete len:65 (-),score=5.69 NODE_2058_length_515_cov_2.523605_g1680_i0:143-337(-)
MGKIRVHTVDVGKMIKFFFQVHRFKQHADAQKAAVGGEHLHSLLNADSRLHLYHLRSDGLCGLI